MRYFIRPLGPEPRRRTLSFAGFITKTVQLYRGASSSRKTLLRNLFREPFTVLVRLASGPLVNSYHTDHKKGRAKKLSLFCGRGDGIRALGGRARKTADVRCFVVGRYLRPAQAMLAGLPSNPVSPLLDIQKQGEPKSSPFFVVEATGFEPTTSWSRTKRATICATPRTRLLYYFLQKSSIKSKSKIKFFACLKFIKAHLSSLLPFTFLKYSLLCR